MKLMRRLLDFLVGRQEPDSARLDDLEKRAIDIDIDIWEAKYRRRIESRGTHR